MLEALGWDLHNLDQCGYEMDPKGELWGKKPADYVLGSPSGRTVVVIEAKRMANRLTTEKEEEQLAGYVEGLPSGLAVLTNGTDWYIYNLRKHGGLRTSWSGNSTFSRTMPVKRRGLCIHGWMRATGGDRHRNRVCV